MASPACEFLVAQPMFSITKDDIRAVLAGTTPDSATFPGPLIKGNKVRQSYPQAIIFLTFRHQGDHFRIKVNNGLPPEEETMMDDRTSIVCTAPRQTDNTVTLIIASIGTGSSKTILAGQMVMVSPS